MKKFIIYAGGFLIGVFSIICGYFFVPMYKLHDIYKLHVQNTILLIIVSYVVFGLPPVTVYFKLLLKDKWTSALTKAALIVLGIIVLLGYSTYKSMTMPTIWAI